jgi:predicted GH43/DUF377 family glycosyl hydrolase
MNWIKKGLIWKPNPSIWWQQYYGILPTPEYIENQDIIRVYFATTCAEKYGRITYVDLDADNPSKVLYEAHEPILDLGQAGCFDDCGLNPSSIVTDEIGNKLLYYVGYQRSHKMPYMLYAGLAIQQKGQPDWQRWQQTPILDRSPQIPYSSAAPFVLKEADTYKMWFWIARNWTLLNQKPYLQAYIAYAESQDGKKWNVNTKPCIEPNGQTEFSVGRPWIYKTAKGYQMWYSVRYVDKLYRLGYAESLDGIDWQRKDEQVGIDVSSQGWDSEMICYPAVLKVKNKLYLFYNGNNNGITGFGYAELQL